MFTPESTIKYPVEETGLGVEECQMVDIEAEKKALRKMIEKAFKAEDEKDMENTLAYFADDAIVQGAGIPQFKGIKAAREFFARADCTFRSILRMLRNPCY
jgi:ketosteroid isomerase-like protein